MPVQFQCRRDVNGRRDNVIGGLAFVDVVVRMDGRFRSDDAADAFDSAVGNHLVGVHVGGGAGAGLIDVHYELVVQSALNDFVGG